MVDVPDVAPFLLCGEQLIIMGCHFHAAVEDCFVLRVINCNGDDCVKVKARSGNRAGFFHRTAGKKCSGKEKKNRDQNQIFFAHDGSFSWNFSV